MFSDASVGMLRPLSPPKRSKKQPSLGHSLYRRLQIKALSIALRLSESRQFPLALPFPPLSLMTFRLGTRPLSRALRQQSPRCRKYSSIQQLPGDYSVVLPKEPFAWGVSHIIPRPVPIHIPRPPYIKGDRTILHDPKQGEPHDGDGRILLGSSEEKSLRKAALLARDALNYASTFVKVITSLTNLACV